MSRASSPSEELDQQLQKPPLNDEEEFLHGSALWLVVIGVLLSIFLIALDQTIVANALPVIASKFDALSSLSWVPTAFLLTQAPSLLIFGQITTLYTTKWVFIVAVALFEIGSLLSGVATSIGFLIFARAFQGVGAAGIFVCAISITAEIIPLQTRPRFFGLFGGLFAISSILGPLLGGAFVDHVSWRWCFYINLPLSVPTFIFCLQFIKAKPPRIDAVNPPAPRPEGSNPFVHLMKHVARRSLKVDWVAAILVIGATTCLVLALQWGGNAKPWNDRDVIATFVTSGVLFILFILWEAYMGGAKAMLPLFLFKNRTQVGACLVGMFTRLAFFVPIYYLPLYFQAVKGHDPLKSGIDLIPITLAVVFTAGIGGFIVSKTGRYWHILFLGPLVGAVGFGLMFIVDENSSWSKIIGIQILMGIGIGCTLQNAIIAVQASIQKELIPQATGLVTFSQFVGGIIGLALASAIFENKLSTSLVQFAPDAPFDAIRQSVSVLGDLPAEERAGAVHAYVIALQWTLGVLGAVSSGVTSLSALLIRNIDIRTAGPRGGRASGSSTPKKSGVTDEKKDADVEASVAAAAV